MIIEYTAIEDVYIPTNINVAKIVLLDELIERFLPIFRDEINKKEKSLNKYQDDFKKLSDEVSKTKTSLTKAREDLVKEKAISEILDEALVLHSRDILYGKNKKIVLDILDSLEKDDLMTLNSKMKILRSVTLKNVQKPN